MINITIDGEEYQAEEGMSVLDTAKKNNIAIPSLCYHPALKPSGSCKLCAVEIPGKSGRQTATLSCILKVKEGLAVKTKGESITEARTRAFHNLLGMAPQSELIRNLAKSCGIDLGPPPDGCIRCRLCIQVCNDIVGPAALKMEKRDGKNYVTPVEGRCIGCGTCANICPTKAIRMHDVENVRTISIRDELIGRHPLERCEGCGRLFETTTFLKHIGNRTVKHPDVKEHHKYCPTCAKLFSDRIRSVHRHNRGGYGRGQ